MFAVVAVLHDSSAAEQVLPVACALANATNVPLYAVDVSVLSWLSNPECASWMWAVIGQDDAEIERRCQQASVDYGVEITLCRVIEKPLGSVVQMLIDVKAQSVVIAGGTLQYARWSGWLRRGKVNYRDKLASELRRSPRSWALTVIAPNGLVREFGAYTGVRQRGSR